MQNFDVDPQTQNRQDVSLQTANLGMDEQTSNLFRSEYLDRSQNQAYFRPQESDRNIQAIQTASLESPSTMLSANRGDFNPFEYRPMAQNADLQMQRRQPNLAGSWDYSREPQFRMQSAAYQGNIYPQANRFSMPDQMHRPMFRPDGMNMPLGPDALSDNQEEELDENYLPINPRAQDLQEYIPRRQESAERPTERTNAPEQTHRLRLDNSAAPGRGRTDAVVFTAAGFNPNAPFDVVVFNHGFRSTAESSMREFNLADQIRRGHPQTVLIVPEWQVNGGASNTNQGRFAQQGFFTNMLKEALQKSNIGQGNLANVDRIHVFSHSAGYAPTGSILNNNPELSNKIHSVTMLDSLYSDTVGRWVQNNMQALANREKYYRNVYGPSTAGNSRAQFARLQQALRQMGRPDAIQNANSSNFREINAGIIFRQTPVGHAQVPNRYIANSIEQSDET